MYKTIKAHVCFSSLQIIYAALITAILYHGVVAIPSVPPPISKNALELQSKIAEASAHTDPPALNVPPGQYVFSNTSLTFKGARNLVVNAKNVTLVFYYGLYLSVLFGGRP